MKLTTQQKKIKLAIELGWGWIQHNGKLILFDPDFFRKNHEFKKLSEADFPLLLKVAVIPDYPNDLNAMHEAETFCLPCDSDELRDKYAELLQEAVYRESEKRAWFSATAGQRFEALGQTLELWEAGE